MLSRYVDAIVIRTGRPGRGGRAGGLLELPVINALTDSAHPCQALADVMTIRERFGRLEGVRLAYLGDGNNVCPSLMVAAAKLGMALHRSPVPEGYEPKPSWRWRTHTRRRRRPGRRSRSRNSPEQAASGADVLYTDVWASMGQEAERRAAPGRSRALPHRRALIDLAGPEAIVMHCLPAHCGEEISEEIALRAAFGVWDQAENRLHAQKAVMALVIPSKWGYGGSLSAGLTWRFITAENLRFPAAG